MSVTLMYTLQVCETRMSCDDNTLKATIHKSCVKSCSSNSSCQASTYLQYGQQCSDCCNTALCNKGGRVLSCYSKYIDVLVGEWTDGRTEGWTVGQEERQTNRQADRQTKRQLDRQTD